MNDQEIRHENYRKNINILMVSTPIIISGFQIIQPYISLYWKIVGKTYIFVGILSFLTALIQILGFSISGALSDKFGRKKILVFATFGYSTGFLAYIFAKNIYELILAALLLSVFTSISTPAFTALFADSIPSNRRATYFSLLNITISLPYYVAPLLGGYLLGKYGFMYGFKRGLILSIFLIIVGASIRLCLHETIKNNANKNGFSINTFKETLLDTFKFIRKLNKTPRLLLCIQFLDRFTLGLTNYLIIFYVLEVVGLSISQYSYALTIFGMICTALSFPAGKIADKKGWTKTLLLTFLAYSFLNIFFIFCYSFAYLLVIWSFSALFYALHMSSWKALTVDVIKLEERGRYSALMEMVGQISFMVSSLLGAVLYTFLKPLPWCLSAILDIFIFGVLLKVDKMKTSNTHSTLIT